MDSRGFTIEENIHRGVPLFEFQVMIEYTTNRCIILHMPAKDFGKIPGEVYSFSTFDEARKFINDKLNSEFAKIKNVP